MLKNIILILFVICLSALPFKARAEENKIYHRIMNTQTIHCGYAEWPPFLAVDPNTGKVSGMLHDVWELIGKKLGLQIKWDTPLGWGEVITSLNSGKIDMFCAIVWPDTGRTKNLLLSRPLFYNPIYYYSKADDKRFDNDYEKLNSPAFAVVGQEGDVTETVFAVKLPNAKKAHIPPMAQQGDMIESVMAGKGAVTLLDVPYASDFMAHNPNKIRQVPGPPVMIMQDDIPMAVGETQLKNMIDTVVTDMINDGTIAALVKKYNAQETYVPEPDVKIPTNTLTK
jgi:ABC-type amino acid transport substrate-binding protein